MHQSLKKKENDPIVSEINSHIHKHLMGIHKSQRTSKTANHYLLFCNGVCSTLWIFIVFDPIWFWSNLIQLSSIEKTDKGFKGSCFFAALNRIANKIMFLLFQRCLYSRTKCISQNILVAITKFKTLTNIFYLKTLYCNLQDGLYKVKIILI